mmetsp:Transcript_11324/g.28037  ORF Transcript_11324/g.28037 Transcript_11324/m.28037 type:complete len:429 (+) Transcript_11324:3-1289(+)
MGVYYFHSMFLERAYEKMGKRWRAIAKRQPYISLLTGEPVIPPPDTKNAYRLEMFVSDSFEFSSRMCALCVDAQEEHAKVKRRHGLYSPSHAVSMVSKLHQSWLQAAGATFVASTMATDSKDCLCEVSPLVSYSGEGLGGYCQQEFKLPFYMAAPTEVVQGSDPEMTVVEFEELFPSYIPEHGLIKHVEEEITMRSVISAWMQPGEAAQDAADDSESLGETPREILEERRLTALLIREQHGGSKQAEVSRFQLGLDQDENAMDVRYPVLAGAEVYCVYADVTLNGAKKALLQQFGSEGTFSELLKKCLTQCCRVQLHQIDVLGIENGPTRGQTSVKFRVFDAQAHLKKGQMFSYVLDSLRDEFKHSKSLLRASGGPLEDFLAADCDVHKDSLRHTVAPFSTTLEQSGMLCDTVGPDGLPEKKRKRDSA